MTVFKVVMKIKWYQQDSDYAFSVSYRNMHIGTFNRLLFLLRFQTYMKAFLDNNHSDKTISEEKSTNKEDKAHSAV